MKPDTELPIILALVAIGIFVILLRRYRTVLMGFTLYNVFLVVSTSLSAFWFGTLSGVNDVWITPAHLAVFTYSTLGLISMGLGIMVAWRPLRQHGGNRAVVLQIPEVRLPQVSWLNPTFVYLLVGIGAVAYLLRPFMSSIPTVSAIWSNFSRFLEVSVFVALCHGLIRRKLGPLLVSLCIFFVLAVLAMFGSGHVGAFGPVLIQGLFIIFLARRAKLRSLLLLLPLVIPLLGLYIGWMNTRVLIRAGHLSNLSTIEAVSTFGGELLEASNPFKLEPEQVHDILLLRLDGTDILAAQVEHQPTNEPFAYGKTVTQNLLATLVPRFLWPEKPVRAGGTEFVSRYSGMIWTEQVSVGLPYQFELYANGGTWFVVIGLFVVGWITARLELSLFQNHVSLRKLLSLFIATVVLCSGGEQMYLTIMALITGMMGTYALGFALEKFSPDFCRRALGLERRAVAGGDAVVERRTVVSSRQFGGTFGRIHPG